MNVDMGSMGVFSSGRKLKTYARSSRNVAYKELRRRTPDERSNLIAPFVAKEAGAVSKGKSCREAETGTPRRIPSAQSRVQTKTPRKLQHPSAVKTNNNVYDIPSSDEDSRNQVEKGPKRRKLDNTKADWRAKGVDRVRIDSRKGAQQKRVEKSEERPKTPAKKFVQSENKKVPRVEVVVRTPPSVKTRRTTQPNRGHEQKHPKPLNKPETKRPISASPPRNPFQPKATPVTRRAGPSASTFIRKPVKPSLSRTPSQKLQEMTQHLPTDSYLNLPVKRSLNGGKERQADLSTETPGTPFRTRLIDALNLRESESSDDSSDSDTVMRSPPSSNSRSNSQASSIGVGAPSSQSIDTIVLPTNPRRQPATSSQLQQTGLRVTYARQRSFRTQNDMDSSMTGTNGVKSASASQEDPFLFDLNTPLLPSKPATTPTDLDESNDTGPGTVRSLHELRRAGGNARYQAVIESIFEDLEDKSASTSRKRSGLIQLCSKLIDPDFARRFVSNSLEKRLSRCTENESDMICRYLSICIYALLLTLASISPAVLSTCHAQILNAAPFLITERRDISELSKLRTTNMSKAGQTSLRNLSAELRDSKIWPETSPANLSPQNMTLRALELAVRKVREAGDQSSTIPSSLLAQVVELLLQYSLGGGALEDDLLVLEMTFSILESYTVGLPCLDGEQEKILKRLARLGSLLAQLGERTDALSRQIQILQIRLILNITNNNPSLCDDFATPDLVGALARLVLVNFGAVAEDLASGSGDKKESLLDTVILALGTLINLGECSGASRRLFLQMKSGEAVLVDGLMELFTSGLEVISEVCCGLAPPFRMEYGVKMWVIY